MSVTIRRTIGQQVTVEGRPGVISWMTHDHVRVRFDDGTWAWVYRSMAQPAQAAVGARVRVTFPGNDWHDPETLDGTVTDLDDDSLEITPDGATIGEDFTLYRSELADGRATLEVL